MKYLIATIILCLNTLAVADTDIIESNIVNYWDAYKKGRFIEASTYVYPLELERTKQKLLPIFIRASKSDNPNFTVIADAFFGNNPRNMELNAAFVFEGLLNMATTLNPDLMGALSELEINSISVQYTSTTEATAYYESTVNGQLIESSENVILYNGDWYLRVKESPDEAAMKFNRIFGF